jgi:hypothetical protein
MLKLGIALLISVPFENALILRQVQMNRQKNQVYLKTSEGYLVQEPIINEPLTGVLQTVYLVASHRMEGLLSLYKGLPLHLILLNSKKPLLDHPVANVLLMTLVLTPVNVYLVRLSHLI